MTSSLVFANQNHDIITDDLMDIVKWILNNYKNYNKAFLKHILRCFNRNFLSFWRRQRI